MYAIRHHREPVMNKSNQVSSLNSRAGCTLTNAAINIHKNTPNSRKTKTRRKSKFMPYILHLHPLFCRPSRRWCWSLAPSFLCYERSTVYKTAPMKANVNYNLANLHTLTGTVVATTTSANDGTIKPWIIPKV